MKAHSGTLGNEQSLVGIRWTRKAALGHPRHRTKSQFEVRAFDAESAGQQAAELLKRLTDDRTWQSQSPHYGTKAARDLLDAAQKQIPVSLPSVDLSSIKADSLKLPSVQLPSFSLPSVDFTGIRADSVKFPSVQLPSFSAAPGQFPKLAAEDLQDVASRISEWGQRTAGSAGQYASSLVNTPAGALPNITALEHAEPHYGSHAVQRSAAGLLEWLQAQYVGQSTLGSLGASASRQLGGLLEEVSSRAHEFGSGAMSVPAGIFGTISANANAAPRLLLGDIVAVYHTAADAFADLSARGIGGYNTSTVTLLFLGALTVVLATAPRPGEEPYSTPAGERPLPWEYDAQEVAAYWAQRPVALATRSMQVFAAALWVGSGLLYDQATGGMKRNAPQRAKQVRTVIERLGAAYIKVAQAISTRVDILSPEYLIEIERLQDDVPPFPTVQALKTVERSLGRPTAEVFASISPKPLAAASLGQVYRATLTQRYGGGDVAIKVQRPEVRKSVALDLLLMRQAATFAQRFPQVSTDWVGLIDEWARRFFHELDYEREARSAMQFKEQMEPLGGITVAPVYTELTSGEVLTTAWVQGEKLSESTASDVRQLCSTLLNCYLIQLLETGLLHADPHPGNLLRTADGKICILDFGLMTEVAPERRIALVEYIAHLSVQDWNGVAKDLVNLGFTPEGGPDPGEAGLVGPLGEVLTQLSKGGGAKGINIDDVTRQLEELTTKYPFQIPSYFALILRAFSVIEGIALRVDPGYSIVQECFPYIARRLLTDNHPRTRAALQQLLYANKSRIDIGRLRRLSSAFSNYTVEGLTASSAPVLPAGPRQPTAALDKTTAEALKLVFRTEGSYAQEVLVDELVAAVDTLQRYAVSGALQGLLASLPAALASNAVRALGPWRPLLLPLPTPLELLNRLQPAVKPTQQDEEVLASVRSIVELVQDQGMLQSVDASSSAQLTQLIRQVLPLLPELAPGLGYTGQLFARAYLKRLAERLSAQPGAQVTDMPVQRMDRQFYGNSNGGGSVVDMQLQGAALSGGPSMAYREPVAASPGAATVVAAQGRDKSMPAMRKL
ncbi:g7925 [Coccomyxa viridis]|uniref:G7925 protein n=1 Tax=Coccomyxa viridis TaxID=1274662 RepID=A0ABP1FZ42_9CHLO